MSQDEIRQLLRNADKAPLCIWMDDGKSYVVTHPDFALMASTAILLASGPGHDFGASFVVCWFDHISRIEVLNQPAAPVR